MQPNSDKANIQEGAITSLAEVGDSRSLVDCVRALSDLLQAALAENTNETPEFALEESELLALGRQGRMTAMLRYVSHRPEGLLTDRDDPYAVIQLNNPDIQPRLAHGRLHHNYRLAQAVGFLTEGQLTEHTFRSYCIAVQDSSNAYLGVLKAHEGSKSRVEVWASKVWTAETEALVDEVQTYRSVLQPLQQA